MNCPICGNELHRVAINVYDIVMDGNSIYKCSKDDNHKFWAHPFCWKIINHNPNASSTSYVKLKSWKILDDGMTSYEEIEELVK